jgi:octaprenyl-diphosphate synthase
LKVVEEIKKPIFNEMELFEKKFYESMSTKVSLLNRITHFIVRRKGKQMRPMFVFLCAKLVGNGKVNEKTYRGASVIELIHTATLVHDDVIDDSSYRRGFFSINALWKNKIAVLVGDYLLSKGLLLCIEKKDFDILEIISVAVREMSEGELLQIEKARNLNITEEIYFEIIRQKTASLISACCAIGVSSVTNNSEYLKKIKILGEYIGIAFQIKDDLFDYGSKKIGKPIGIDIKDQKMTLPFIFCMNNSNSKDKKWLINSIKNHNKNKKRVKEIISFVNKNGGIEYAKEKMEEFKLKAVKTLRSFSKNKYRDSLEMTINYVISRNQ